MFVWVGKRGFGRVRRWCGLRTALLYKRSRQGSVKFGYWLEDCAAVQAFTARLCEVWILACFTFRPRADVGLHFFPMSDHHGASKGCSTK